MARDIPVGNAELDCKLVVGCIVDSAVDAVVDAAVVVVVAVAAAEVEMTGVVGRAQKGMQGLGESAGTVGGMVDLDSEVSCS